MNSTTISKKIHLDSKEFVRSTEIKLFFKMMINEFHHLTPAEWSC